MNLPNDSFNSPSFGEAFRFWLKLGFISFGGPTGQIAIMHQELVERKKWISEERFLHALNYCMLLPGPEAQQLAIYIGWLLHRTLGGLVAGILFVLPSVFVLWFLSYVYVAFGHVELISSILSGLKPAVLAIVLVAVIRIGRKALKNEIMWALAGAAFVSLSFFKVSFPLVILVAAVTGWLGRNFWKEKFLVVKGHDTGSPNIGSTDRFSPFSKSTLRRVVGILCVGLTVWWLPILMAGGLLGWNHVVFQEGVFFSKAAMVTFGGAYAVLPYVAQLAVEKYGWLHANQMIDGLGLAETTPGPLIMVLQFVGFLGGWNQPGQLTPLMAATLGAFLSTWATFVPCFVWIFLGAPYIEYLRGNETLTSTLSAVTAAVVGVVLNLAVWFGIHVLCPEGKEFNVVALSIASVSFISMLQFKVGVIPIVGYAGLAGFLLFLVGVI